MYCSTNSEYVTISHWTPLIFIVLLSMITMTLNIHLRPKLIFWRGVSEPVIKYDTRSAYLKCFEVTYLLIFTLCSIGDKTFVLWKSALSVFNKGSIFRWCMKFIFVHTFSFGRVVAFIWVTSEAKWLIESQVISCYSKQMDRRQLFWKRV